VLRGASNVVLGAQQHVAIAAPDRAHRCGCRCSDTSSPSLAESAGSIAVVQSLVWRATRRVIGPHLEQARRRIPTVARSSGKRALGRAALLDADAVLCQEWLPAESRVGRARGQERRRRPAGARALRARYAASASPDQRDVAAGAAHRVVRRASARPGIQSAALMRRKPGPERAQDQPPEPERADARVGLRDLLEAGLITGPVQS